MTIEGQGGRRRARILRGALTPYSVLRGNVAPCVLLLCHLCSRIVQWLYLVALMVVAYNVTHAPQTVALLTFVRFLPNALLLPISGALTDHVNRKVLMVVSNGGRAVCMVGLLFVHNSATLPLAYALLFVATVLSSLFRPSLVATLPSIVDERELLRANGLVSQAEMISQGAGPALAGVLLLAGRADAAFVVAGVVFALCALALALVRLPARSEHGGSEDVGWLEHLGSGFDLLLRRHDRVLVGYSAALGGMQLLNGASWTISLVLSERVFGFGGQGAGFLNAAYGVGGFVGGMLMGLVLVRGRFTLLFSASIVASCVFATLYGFSPIGALALFFNLGTGAADVFAKVSAISVIQSATPTHMIGRVFGAFESILILGQLLGSIAVGPAISALGPREANFAFALVGLVVLVLCTPLLRRTENQLGSRIFLRSVPALETVAFHLLDDLAARVRVETFSPGSAIVREGEPGTALYVIKRGEVDVVARGASTREIHLATLSTMDYFGEQALVNDAPRNASVLARGTVDVYRLDGADFHALLQRVGNLRAAIDQAGADRDLNRESRMLAGL